MSNSGLRTFALVAAVFLLLSWVRLDPGDKAVERVATDTPVEELQPDEIPGVVDPDNPDDPNTPKASVGGGSTAVADPSKLKCNARENGGPTDKGVTATKINLATTAVLDGPARTLLEDSPKAMKAVIDRVNRGGGICGRLLDLRVVNDSFQADVGLRSIRSFVDEGYFSLPVVPSAEGLGSAIINGEISKARMPVIGTDGLRKEQYNDPYVWPVASATVTAMRVMAKYAFTKRDAHTFAIVYDEKYKFGVEGKDAFESQVKALGGTMVPGATIGLNPDDNSYASTINDFNTKCKDGKCDMVALLLLPETAKKWLQGSAVFGAKYTAGAQTLFTDRFAQDCVLLRGGECSGFAVWTGYNPPIGPLASLAGVASYVSDVRAVKPGIDVNNQFVEGAYLGMSVFVEALKRVGPNLTRDRLRAAMDSMTFESDIASPLTWKPGQHSANVRSQSFSMTVSQGAFRGWSDEGTGFLLDPLFGGLTADMLKDVVVSLVLSLPLIGAYAIFAIGIVLIYRASRMLNLAHGAMAMIPGYVLYELVRAGLPTVIAFPVGIIAGAGLGLAVEWVFVRRLRGDGPTAQTVGTVAALGIMVALAVRTWGTAGLRAAEIFPRGRVSVGESGLQYGEIGLFVVMLVVGAALFLLIQRTDLGLIMRGTAESRLAASLMGVNPDRITSLAWAMGGALAALAGILLAAVTSLHPYALSLQVLPAFIAALIGGLGSLPGALVGSAIVGSVQGLVPLFGSVGKLQGAPQLFLAVLAIVTMATRGKALVGADDAVAVDVRATTTAKRVQRDDDDESRRRVRQVGFVLAIVGIVAFPYLPGITSSMVGAANLAAVYTVIAVALVLLTGWVGQISLGHAALVGIGAYATGHIVEGLGVPFPLSLPLAAAVSGTFAAVLGGVAVRIRGLYLAVATLVFAWMASEFLFRQEWFIKHGQIGERPIGEPGALPYFDFSDRRTFFLVAAATAALVVFGAANLRDSKTGRAFFALRGSEMAAASLGIDVVRYKFIAFVTSGAIAGVAGNLIMTDARVVTPDQFTFNISLFYVAIAVVGGLTSLPGAVASGVLFAALAEVFYRVEALGAFLEIVSSLLLAVVLIAYRGGLASIPERTRRWGDLVLKRSSPLILRLSERIPVSWPGRRPVEDEPATARASGGGLLKQAASAVGSGLASARQAVNKVRARLPLASLRPGPDLSPAAPLDFKAALGRVASASTNGHVEAALSVDDADASDHGGHSDIVVARARLTTVQPSGLREERQPLIAAENVTVRFGGLTAVNDASLTVREGEIVGLIGPNGAGKTTLFNAIAGYNSPSDGTIRLYGQNVTHLPVHRRARVGVARTFQLIQLFRELSVYENLLVATHVHNPTGFGAHLLVSGSAVQHENDAVDRVNEILELLDLTDLADRTTGDLPFGVLRMIEVARALVTGFRVVMLDEPASGLDNAETDRLIEVLRFVRGLGVTLLLIEHDVRMVTGVSDYMYVLEQGRMIAEGEPVEIQRNPLVVAAYLGEPVAEREKEPVG